MPAAFTVGFAVPASETIPGPLHANTAPGVVEDPFSWIAGPVVQVIVVSAPALASAARLLPIWKGMTTLHWLKSVTVTL